LRPLSGCEKEVADYVLRSQQGMKFLELLQPLLLFLVAAVVTGEKKAMRVAIGCTGGRHRSVAIVEALHDFLAVRGVEVSVFHRDKDRETTA
ncbi:MAG: RNase adaptor protein RapZ, partial [Desulfofustis sp.]|nr:RNase adaptor protein RapZ [Desulfofustis sp.]